MDSHVTCKDALASKTNRENILLEVIKELCSNSTSQLSAKLAQKMNRIIAGSEFKHFASLHKLSTANESTSSLLGIMNLSATGLTFDEQSELNRAIIQQLQNKLPSFISELNNLQQIFNKKLSQGNKIKELKESLNEKLDLIQSQENEKVDLMTEWINHRHHAVSKFNEDSSELQTLKTKILELKSKILHIQILQNIFTETNKSIKAFSEIHNQLRESMAEIEGKIKNLKDIVEKNNY